MTIIARHVRVSGRVQGVFFRAWACQQARELDVRGWVWNSDDGSVEAHLQGEDGAVERLIDLMRQGPPAAKVGNVEVDEAEMQPYDCFEVRH